MSQIERDSSESANNGAIDDDVASGEFDKALLQIGNCCPDCIVPCADGALSDTVTAQSSVMIRCTISAEDIKKDTKMLGALKKAVAKNLCAEQTMAIRKDCTLSAQGGYPLEKSVVITGITKKAADDVTVNWAYTTTVLYCGEDASTVASNVKNAASTIDQAQLTTDIKSEYSKTATASDPAYAVASNNCFSAIPSTQVQTMTTSASGAPSLPAEAGASSDEGADVGLIVGAVIGALVGVALAVFGGIIFTKHKSQATKSGGIRSADPCGTAHNALEKELSSLGIEF